MTSKSINLHVAASIQVTIFTCCVSLTDAYHFAGQKVRDLRNWLTIYSYWNQGGQDNVATMLLYLVDQYVARTGITPPPVQETPPTGQSQDLFLESVCSVIVQCVFLLLIRGRISSMDWSQCCQSLLMQLLHGSHSPFTTTCAWLLCRLFAPGL